MGPLAPERVLFICRGRPGLGRVSPSVALAQEWRRIGLAIEQMRFLTYGVGLHYLSAIGLPFTKLTEPSGQFIDPLSESAAMCLAEFMTLRPNVVIVDGEPYLVPLLAAYGASVVFLANPHDLLGETNLFRVMHRSYLRAAKRVITCGLQDTCIPETIDINGLNVHLCKPLVKPRNRKISRPLSSLIDGLRVLVCAGGGVLEAGDIYKRCTSRFVEVAVDLLQSMTFVRTITVLPSSGLDDVPNELMGSRVQWLTGFTELVDLFPDYDIVVARAGRNITSEVLAYGIPAVLVPIAVDPLRGGEQLANARFAARHPSIQMLSLEELDQEEKLTQAVKDVATTQVEPIFELGNPRVLALIADVLNSVQPETEENCQWPRHQWANGLPECTQSQVFRS